MAPITYKFPMIFIIDLHKGLCISKACLKIVQMWSLFATNGAKIRTRLDIAVLRYCPRKITTCTASCKYLTWNRQEGCENVSIAPTFYVQLFRTKFKRSALLHLKFGSLLFWGSKNLAEKLLVKCWWNWQHVGLSKFRRTKNLTICTAFETINAVNRTSVNRDTEKINRSKITISLIQIICIVSYRYFWEKICIVRSYFTFQHKTNQLKLSF